MWATCEKQLPYSCASMGPCATHSSSIHYRFVAMWANSCKLSCISYTCIKKALLRRSSSVQCPNEINVGAMQAIPESREKLSHSSGITWFHLSLAHTSWCYREAIFIRGVRSLGSQEKGDEASSCRIRDRRSESDKSRSVPSRLVPSRINNMPGCTFEGR